MVNIRTTNHVFEDNPSSRLRTSPHIIIYYNNGQLVIENYITRQTFNGTRDTLILLDFFREWRTIAEASRHLEDYSPKSISISIQNLLRNRLLIVKGSDEDMLDRKFSRSWLWPIPSRYYHFATKLDQPISTSDESRKFYEKYLKGRKQPPLYKTYPKSIRTRLPAASKIDAPLFSTMRKRKTSRAFSGGPLSAGQLSKIIFYTWGRLSTYWTREFGELLHKTSPSAGARHPIEAYLVVNNVTGVQKGIYHYSVLDHSLELLKQGDFRKDCVRFTAGQVWTENASVLFLMTAVIPRTTWKYRIPRAYRAFLLDAGHLSQSFLLASTAVGLEAFCIGIISEVTIEKALEIDGIEETVLFAVGVGQPANPVKRTFGRQSHRPVTE